MADKKRAAAWAVAGAVLLAAVAGSAWWAGRHAGGRVEAPQAPELVGTADPFAWIDCKTRVFDESLALAITFSQPLDRRQDLGALLRVVDLGVAPGEAGEDHATRQPRPAAGAVEGAVVRGDWTIGDNPRVAYFPFIEPKRRYAIAAQGEIKGPAGQASGSGYRCEVSSEAMPPSFYFASRGVVLPARQNGGLPVVTVNTPEVDVQFLRLAPAQFPRFFEQVLGVRRSSPDQEDAGAGQDNDDDTWRYSSNRSLQGSVGSWDLDRLKDLAKSVYAGRFVTDDKPNRRHVTFLPVEDIEELAEPGIYVAVMSQPGRFRDEYQVTYFYVSDIGLHARRYAGQLDAFATSLKNGTAIDDVEFELLDGNAKSLGRAKADSQGHATFAGSLDAARILLARRGDELSVVPLAQPALDLSEFDVGGHASRDNKVFVYAGRDLYRPGEQFDVSVLVRDADGRAMAPVPITATLKRPDGRAVRTVLWRPDVQIPGYIRQRIELPNDAQSGTWMLEARLDPAARAADASWKFQVEEFLPERVKLALSASEGVLQPGRPLKVQVQGDYLYGAPAAGNRLLGMVSIERDRYALPVQWPGFLFGDFADDDRTQRRDLEETTLDAQGAAAVAVPVDVTGVASPMAVQASFSLLESGGRPVVRSVERSVWPAPSLIAIRPLFDRDVAREGAVAEFEAVRVDAQGRTVPLEGAQLRLYREDRVYYWRFDDQRGWNNGFTETEELVESRTVALPGRVKLGVPVKWGRYRLELTDPEHGATLRYRFYAGWGAQDAEEMGNRPDRVQLKLDHAPVREGDTVKLVITPPHDGQALVAVEAGKLLWSHRTSVKASGSTVEIPIGKDWGRHDLYVSVAVFRPGSEGDRVTPARALGLVYLPLAREERKLDVAISAPAKVLPEKQSTVTVKVGPADAGQQAYVTLSAVDAGILNITQYAAPDPFDFFFGKHRYAPELLDLYGRLIEKMDGTPGRLKWGGDAAMRDTRSMPVKVRLVDLFSGPVRLDAQGEARIPLDLPDFNGTLRLMATAFAGERFGSAQGEMVVAAPVVAELSTPRFISPGDDAAVALDVTNLSGAPQTLAVTLEGLDPVRILGGSQRVTLANRQRTTLRFTAQATGAYGLGRLRLMVHGEDGPNPIRIVRESLLQVQPPVAAAREMRRVRLAQGESLRLDPAWLSGLYPESASVGVAISNRPPLNVKRLVQGLFDYPYGCLEQTASAAYPHLFVGEEEARAWGLEPRPRAERERLVEGAVSRIAGMQKAGGGFALWGDGAQEIWLSAYVAGFLQDARAAGFDVPDLMARRAMDWLLAQLQQSSANFPSLPQNLLAQLAAGPGQRLREADYNLLRDSHRRFAELAHAGYVLAREQKAPLSTLRVLYDQYSDRARSPLPLVHLGAALKLMGDETRARAAFDLAMTRGYGIDANRYGSYGEWLGDYGSALRDYAMSYALMMQHRIDHPRREALLNDVAGRLGNRAYLSTQEQLALFLAARAAGGVAGASWSATLRTGEGEQPLGSRDTESRSFTAAQLAGGIDILNTQADPLFVEVDVQGYPRQPEPPRASGITIARSWYEADGRPWSGRPLRTGEILIVRLDVASDRRIEDALVVDRVPAGLEVENMNLSQGPDMADWRIGDVRVSDALDDPRIKHREYRDDRYVAAVGLQGPVTIFYRARVVTPGRFVVPAPMAEDMYRPEIRAVGAPGGTLVIADPRPAGQ
ncbi:MAG: alpha-2-macroglobulin [Pigmentiphaga sp.]|uniref:alpha-2-macroglobulin family protein n=1 Tax=Pigmentiphaga sp. TaxID=1977564 RepID=UPI0029A8E629|nr:alpha-2-macroglobulin [Pigmentiphaga sp.]MDX3904216.1 alpha-2-macroglobulin [Pigmentiphaga sp.]